MENVQKPEKHIRTMTRGRIEEALNGQKFRGSTPNTLRRDWYTVTGASEHAGGEQR